MKICRATAELFHANGETDIQTDVAKLIVIFRNIGNAYKCAILYKTQRKMLRGKRLTKSLTH